MNLSIHVSGKNGTDFGAYIFDEMHTFALDILPWDSPERFQLHFCEYLKEHVRPVLLTGGYATRDINDFMTRALVSFLNATFNSIETYAEIGDLINRIHTDYGFNPELATDMLKKQRSRYMESLMTETGYNLILKEHYAEMFDEAIQNFAKG